MEAFFFTPPVFTGTFHFSGISIYSKKNQSVGFFFGLLPRLYFRETDSLKASTSKDYRAFKANQIKSNKTKSVTTEKGGKMKVSHNMAILFWHNLSKKNDAGEAPIYCRITVNQKRGQFSKGIFITEDKWDGDAKIIKGSSEQIKTWNNDLAQTKGKLITIYNQLQSLHELVTPEMIINKFKGITPQRKTLLDTFKEYNKQLKERTEAKEPTLTKKTLARFEVTKNKVEAFIRYKYHLSDKSLTDIPPAFGNDLKHYLTTTDNLSVNTAMKYIKNTKQVLEYASDQEYIPRNPIHRFKCTYKDPKRERLTWEELMIMHKKQMPITRLEEVKDAYLFECFVGYSYIDLYKLEPENVIPWIDGNKWLIKNREKSDGKSNVPLLEIPLAIIEKYKDHPYCVAENKLLPINSNQRYNGYLKEVADICNIRKNLTTHTARHTFATTILLENDCPIEAVSEMLGHNSIRTTQIYAKTTDVKIKNNMKEVKHRIEQKMTYLQHLRPTGS